jgi:glycosyltransferase involved in cell wall biosynthesis
MDRRPLVSIVTPFWNAARFFPEAIESVLAQSYVNWELLLIDDGSPDESTVIAQRYAQQHPGKIHYLAHVGRRNLGKSSSRNLGFRQARGEYVALLDADDIYLPQKLERQVAILEAHPQAGMVYGPTQYWHSWTGAGRDARRDKVAKLGVPPRTLFQPPALLTRFLQNSGIVPCTCGLLARRSVVDACGGFDERIQHLYEDQVFLAKICLAAAVYADDGCWDRYRRHEESSWHLAHKAGQERESRLIFLQWLEAYLAAEHVDDEELWRALRGQFWPYEHPRLAALAEGIKRATGPGRRLARLVARRARLVAPRGGV